ncbi:MAG: cation-translocating P-type ATPase [Acidobacteria bacterium]|nr:cation-translocating P-type ATPase [Acidobacteriota bacterium]
MDCGEEVAQLRRQLGSMTGVLDLRFDVERAQLAIEHDAEVVSPGELEAAITRLGMRSEIWKDTRDQPAHPLLRHSRALATAASGACLVAAMAIDFAESHEGLLDWFLRDGGHHGSPTVVAVQCLALLFGFGPHLAKVMASLRAFRPDMAVLMAVSLTGAGVLGEWSEGATLAFLYSLSGLIELWSLRRAQSSVAALLNLTPPTASVLHGDHEHKVSVDRLQPGALVRVRPGERIPCDGEVAAGESDVDQAIVTGEAVPSVRGPGDRVFSGSLNGAGTLDIRVGCAAHDTALSRIVRMVEGAQHRRATSEQFVERFARVYTPVILGLAVAAAVLPPALGWQEASRSFYQAMVILLISCPCALVISTPVTIVSALASAARHGVLVKGGAFLEIAARLNAVAFDKTGVLTSGKPQVTSFTPLNGQPKELVLRRLAGIEAQSEHPLAAAVVAYANQQGVAPEPVEHFHALAGRGAEAEVGRERFWVGSRRLCQEKCLQSDEVVCALQSREDAHHSAVLCGSDAAVWGVLSLSDAIRSEAAEALGRLRALGVRELVMLTGDNRGTADSVGRDLGIVNVKAELLPEQKLEVIEALRAAHGEVAMVGDGINDAQALSAASIGIAMAGQSTDLALETADVVLAPADLRKLPFLIQHARRAAGVVRQNVWVAIGLKVAFLVAALLGAASLWMAVAADMGATLLVTLNGLRMLRASGGRV